MPLSGESHTVVCSDVPRQAHDDFALHLSVGAIKVAKETMEVLSQKVFIALIDILWSLNSSFDVIALHCCFAPPPLNKRRVEKTRFRSTL